MDIKDLYHIYKECRTISTDSRKLIPGSIFFALKGENFDGNLFVLDALEKGCKYAVVDDRTIAGSKHNLSLRILYVTNVLETLQKLAAYHRSQLKIPFIGITGSNGKTTTKELIAAVLSRKFKVCATHGNLNNHIGVPLTVLSVTDHEIAIIEMGANHIGEIEVLCQIADPDYGIITNIGKAHLEGFGSPEGVVKAKSELYDHIALRNAKVFIDAGNNQLMSLARARNLDSVLYGIGEESSCYGEFSENSRFLKATMHFRGLTEKINISTSLVGDYNLNNILAAAGIGFYFGVHPHEIASAITDYKPSNNRSQFFSTPKNKIVLDAYNANPSSMLSSITNFISLKDDLPKMIILGDMLELGEYSKTEHHAIINLLKEKQFTDAILVGPEFCAVADSTFTRCFKNVNELTEHFHSNPVYDHCILLKGSRGIRLEKLLDFL